MPKPKAFAKSKLRKRLAKKVVSDEVVTIDEETESDLDQEWDRLIPEKVRKVKKRLPKIRPTRTMRPSGNWKRKNTYVDD